MTGSDDKTTVSASASSTMLKIPPFMEHDPELWFKIVDKACAAANIDTENAKFGTVIGFLGERCSLEVRDLIMSEDKVAPYTELRDALISRLGASKEQKIRQLLEREEIGDRKPSQYLRHIRGLGGSSFPDDAYKTIFLSQIPQSARAILAAHSDLKLDQLASIADNIIDHLRPATNSFQIAGASCSNSEMPQLEALLNLKFAQLGVNFKNEISAFRREVDERFENENYQRRPRSPHRRRSVSRSRGRSRQRELPASGICYYHWRFGAAANKCEPPCSQENSNGGR